MNGGRWVMVLKIGTKQRPPTPSQKMMSRWALVNWLTSAFGRFMALSNLPLSWYCRINAGTSMEMSEGMKISVMTPCVVMTPLIHSMIVVTSPMGEKAPPLLAEITTSAA